MATAGEKLDAEGNPAGKDLHAIAGGAGLSLLGRVANGAMVFVYGIVVARLLDVRSVGILMLGLAIIKISELVSRMGLEIGILHYVAILKGNGREGDIRGTVRQAALLVLASSALLALVIFVLAPLASRKFALPELETVLRILAASLPPTSVAMILLTALLGLKQMAYNTIGEKIFLPAANLAACTLLLLAGFGLEGASTAYLAGAVLTVPLAVHYLSRCTTAGNQDARPVPAADLLRFSAPIVLVAIMTQAMLWTDTIILGLLRDASEVGIYSAAARTALMAGLVVGSFNMIFAPTISDLYHRKELKHLEYLFKTVSKWMFLVVCPFVLSLVLVSEEVLMLYGATFAAGSTALEILSLAQLIASGTGAVGFMLTMSGRQKIMLVNTVVAFFLNIALNYWFVPQYGIEGAAVATCISITVFCLLALVEVQWALGMHPYSGGHLRILAAGLFALGTLAFAKRHLGGLSYLEALVAYSLAYAALYAAALYVLGLADEEKLIFSTLKRKLLGRP